MCICSSLTYCLCDNDTLNVEEGCCKRAIVVHPTPRYRFPPCLLPLASELVLPDPIVHVTVVLVMDNISLYVTYLHSRTLLIHTQKIYAHQDLAI